MKPQGFTIIETLIFLAVAGGLFISAMALISGKQNKTEFFQAIHETDSRIQQIINNIGTGYYTNTNTFSCTDNAIANARPNISGGSNNQGTNVGCSFIGEVIQFSPNGIESDYVLYTVVGKQFTTKSNVKLPVASISDAMPTAIYPHSFSPSAPDASTKSILPYGLKVLKAKFNKTNAIGGIGFFSSFVGYNSNNNLQSGEQNTDVIPIYPSQLGWSNSQMIQQVDSLGSGPLAINPLGGVTICFQSGSTSQYGVIVLSSSGGHVQTTLHIYDINGYSAAVDPSQACL
ncbi:MAG: hypothetical protein NVS1B7_2680 [Candidatus Saccharimonadales bacterium]